MATIHVAQSYTKKEYPRCLTAQEQRLISQEPSGVIGLDTLAKALGQLEAVRASCASGACACLSSVCCGDDEIQISTIPTGAIDLDTMVRLVGGAKGVRSVCVSGDAGACDCFSLSCCDGALQARQTRKP